jgi:hypothetical protein
MRQSARDAAPTIACEEMRPSAAVSFTSFNRRRSGNMDCTFCLDCVKACPSQNVGILVASPGSRPAPHWQALRRGGFSATCRFSRLGPGAKAFAIYQRGWNASCRSGIREAEPHRPVRSSSPYLFSPSRGQFYIRLCLLERESRWHRRSMEGCAVRDGCSFSLRLGSPCGQRILSFMLHQPPAPGGPFFQRLAKDLGLSGSVRIGTCLRLPLPTGPPFGNPSLLNAGCLYTLWLLWKKCLALSKERPLLTFSLRAFLAFNLLYALQVSGFFSNPVEMRGTFSTSWDFS